MAGSMTVSRRLSLGFGFVMVLMIVIVAFAIMEANSLAKHTVGIVEKDWPKISLVVDMMARTKDNALKSQQLLLLEDRQSLLKQIKDNRKHIEKDIATLDEMIKRQEARTLLQELKALRKQYVAAQTKILTLLENDDREQALAIMNAEILPIQVGMMKTLDQLFDFQGVVLEEDGNEAKSIATETFTVLTILAIC